MDIVWHGIVAAGAVVLFGILRALWFGVLVVSIGFPLREEIQAFHKYKAWIWPWEWSQQKWAEALVPVIVALTIALLWWYCEGLMNRKKFELSRPRD